MKRKNSFPDEWVTRQVVGKDDAVGEAGRPWNVENLIKARAWNIQYEQFVYAEAHLSA